MQVEDTLQFTAVTCRKRTERVDYTHFYSFTLLFFLYIYTEKTERLDYTHFI